MYRMLCLSTTMTFIYNKQIIHTKYSFLINEYQYLLKYITVHTKMYRLWTNKTHLILLTLCYVMFFSDSKQCQECSANSNHSPTAVSFIVSESIYYVAISADPSLPIVVNRPMHSAL